MTALVLVTFSCFNLAMAIFPPLPEPVPFEEVAAVLTAAASRVTGGPPAMVTVSGFQLAAALAQAGFVVVRPPAAGPQLTL